MTPRPTIKNGRIEGLLTDYGYVAIYPQDPHRGSPLVVRYDQGTIAPTGGGTGWVPKPRPYRRPLTVWLGPQAPYSFPLPLLFDGWDSGDSQEADIRALEIWAGVNVAHDPEPPTLIIDAGGALPHDFVNAPQNLWVISDITTGDALRDPQTGERLRQSITPTFMLYTQDAALARLPGKNIGSGRSVKAKAGDTYNKIASRYLRPYGGAKLGSRLSTFNGQRGGGGKTLGPGQIVKIPPASTLEQWKRGARRR